MKLQDEYAEGLVHLGVLGDLFAEYAASRLLSEYGIYSNVYFWMLVSAFNRGDKEAVRRFLTDWKEMARKPSAVVSKFVPGDHYHVLDTKFDTLEEAMEYLHRRGHNYGGLKETHVYKPE